MPPRPASDPASAPGSERAPTRPAPVIGVTGAPAAGKSTVTAAPAGAGCTVIDLDRLGHEALGTAEVRAAVEAEFGAGVVGPDGGLDREALARVAFADEERLARLEALVHPVVRQRMAAEIERARAAGARAVVIDAALLFEGGLDARCDTTVAVHAAPAVRDERARAHRGWQPGEVARRESRQLPADVKRDRADRILVNEAGPDDLRRAALALLDELAPTAPLPTTPDDSPDDAGR